MTWNVAFTLFSAMFALAITPDASALAVVARSVGSGLAHAFVTTLGIIAGDFIFIFLAIYGLWSIQDLVPEGLVFVKYLGGAYLIWMGIGLWRSRPSVESSDQTAQTSWGGDFLVGLLITLGDPKAILFYMSFLPAFIDLTAISMHDAGLILLIAALALGAAKTGYAVLALKALSLLNDGGMQNTLNRFAGATMVGIGLYLAMKS
ncbi:MAG: LysE family translocator [Candidatus Nitrohelix vancouverensis]|uniref:LysE family translocator n=1 Tax=Candidatus Nitrohelix vancouverensis TaxID=2705534 RepID=A0A7T0C531_9BACT|nr:MAG: LysE family translocator [Candidatus Nitrohelix vancouverensis]